MAPVVASEPPVEATAPPPPTLADVASLDPPAPALPPSVVGEPANAPEERAASALRERMPDPEPVPAADPDRELAIGELQRLTLVSHEERAAALRKLPGIGAMADNVARAMASLPPDVVEAMAQSLDLDAIGALSEAANGVAGR